MSGEWLEESELSSNVVHLDSPSIPIQCTINWTPFDALYVGHTPRVPQGRKQADS
jgi:hypothetical protein